MEKQPIKTAQNDSWKTSVTLVDIDKLFAKFAARYGSRWTSQWSDSDLLRIARHEWYATLKNMKLGDIKRGLDQWHEDWPPNVVEFKKTCIPAPCYRDYPSNALPAPKNKALGQKCIKEMLEKLRS